MTHSDMPPLAWSISLSNMPKIRLWWRLSLTKPWRHGSGAPFFCHLPTRSLIQDARSKARFLAPSLIPKKSGRRWNAIRDLARPWQRRIVIPRSSIPRHSLWPFLAARPTGQGQRHFLKNPRHCHIPLSGESKHAHGCSSPERPSAAHGHSHIALPASCNKAKQGPRLDPPLPPSPSNVPPNHSHPSKPTFSRFRAPTADPSSKSFASPLPPPMAVLASRVAGDFPSEPMSPHNFVRNGEHAGSAEYHQRFASGPPHAST